MEFDGQKGCAEGGLGNQLSGSAVGGGERFEAEVVEGEGYLFEEFGGEGEEGRCDICHRAEPVAVS